jgi:hypothetical protein
VADLTDKTDDIALWDEGRTKSVTVTTDGANERLDVSLGAAVVDSKLRVITNPYTYAIAEGVIPGHTYVRKQGYNADVNNTVEDVWPAGAGYVFPTAGIQMKLVSTSANDTAAGTGARTVEIHYLKSSWEESVETITLNGTTAVNTSSSDIFRINAIYILTAGTAASAVGTLNLTNTAGTVTYAQVEAGLSHDRMAIFTVPLGKTLYITQWVIGSGSSAGNAYCEFYLKATCDFDNAFVQNIFFIKNQIACQDNGIPIDLNFPIKCPAKTDIKIAALSDGASVNAKATAQFVGWLE